MVTINSRIIQLHGYGESKVGGRLENQDNFGFFDTPLGFLAIVCDGMGGGPGGKTASYIAKYEILTALSECNPDTPRQNAFKMACARAHEAMVEKMNQVPSLLGMGSTFVAVLINKDSLLIAHAGDSRCYVLRGKKCIFRSNDHSLVAELVKNKALTEEEARRSPQSNIITRGLGSVTNNVPEFDEVKYKKGDRIVLCTDGVWGTMPANDLLFRLSQKSDIASLISNLSSEVDNIGFAGGGHHDNHTIMIIDIDADSSQSAKSENKKLIFGTALIGLCVVIALCCYFLFFYGKKKNVADSNTFQSSSQGVTPTMPDYALMPGEDSPVVSDSLPSLATDSILLMSSDSIRQAVRDSVAKIKARLDGEKPDSVNNESDKNRQISDEAGKEDKIPGNAKDVIDLLIKEINKAETLKSIDSKDGDHTLQTINIRCQDLANLKYLDTLNPEAKVKMDSVRYKLKIKWNIDKTKRNGYHELTVPTKKLLESTRILLNEINNSLN